MVEKPAGGWNKLQTDDITLFTGTSKSKCTHPMWSVCVHVRLQGSWLSFSRRREKTFRQRVKVWNPNYNSGIHTEGEVCLLIKCCLTVKTVWLAAQFLRKILIWVRWEITKHSCTAALLALLLASQGQRFVRLCDGLRGSGDAGKSLHSWHDLRWHRATTRFTLVYCFY